MQSPTTPTLPATAPAIAPVAQPSASPNPRSEGRATYQDQIDFMRELAAQAKDSLDSYLNAPYSTESK